MLEMIRMTSTAAVILFLSVVVILYIRGHVDYEHSIFNRIYSLIAYGYMKMTVDYLHGVDALKRRRLEKQDAFYTYTPAGKSESLQRRELKLAQMKEQIQARSAQRKSYKMKVLK